MNIGGPLLVIIVVAIATIGWVITTAIRSGSKHPVLGTHIVDPRELEASQTTKAMMAENEQLKATVSRLEERLKVLERIATDPTRQLADDIEKLR